MNGTPGGTPESGCPCEGCKVLRTQLGQTMLAYMDSLIKEIRIALASGAPNSTMLQLELDGPAAASLMKLGKTMTTKRYASLDASFESLVDQMPTVMSVPDTKVLRTVYEDDPVAIAIIEWIERRHGAK